MQYNKSTFYQFIPFIFPTLALAIIFTGLTESYTIPLFVTILLLGYVYSFLAFFSKKGLIGSIINMYVTALLMFGSAIFYLVAVTSSV
ncbi:hypothetical protein ACNRWW_08000 [Metabacillus sp. HB246100]